MCGRSCGCDALWLHSEAGGGPRRCAQLSPPHLLLSAAVGQHKAAAGMEPAGAYGAAKAGSIGVDPVAFFKHPRTILRLMCWVSLLCNVRADVNEQACMPPPPNLSVWVSFMFSISLQDYCKSRLYIFPIYETLKSETSTVVSRIGVIYRNTFLRLISAVQLASAAPEAHYHMFIRSLFLSGWSFFAFKYPLSSRQQLSIFVPGCCSCESHVRDQFVLKQVGTLAPSSCLWPFVIVQFRTGWFVIIELQQSSVLCVPLRLNKSNVVKTDHILSEKQSTYYF